MRVRGCYQFRVTRNSDLFVEQEEVDDLLRAVEGELASRRYGDAVRLETAHDCPDEILRYLLEQFALTERGPVQGVGPGESQPLDGALRSRRPCRAEVPGVHARAFRSGCASAAIMFATLRAGDVLLHHPFQGFGPVTDFIKQAASDPQVLAIKQTLYRAGSDSAIVGALVEAAQAGKDVTVIIELRARFDEEANIELANKLQEAGAHVMYGVFGFKTHAKLVMVVRREEKGLRRYCHLGTGNYHAKTARLYTDYGLMTADEAIGEDIHEIFLQLTGLTRVPRLRKLLHAPFSLHQALTAKIEREAEHARAGKPARIVAKLNALTEPTIIQSLYRASQAGIRVDLLVRGLCCLRPGVPGVSERITGALHRRPVSRAFPRLSVRECRRARGVLRQRRLDGPQPLSPDRSRVSGGGARVQGARRRRSESVPGRRLPGVGTGVRTANTRRAEGAGRHVGAGASLEPVRRAGRAHRAVAAY